MFDMNVAWYYQVWPWVGLGGAIVLLILLFATNVLRSDSTILGIGVLNHIVLAGGTLLHEFVGEGVLSIIQVLNAALTLYLWHAAGKIAGGKLVEIKQ